MVLGSCDKILDQESPSSFDDATVYSNYALAEQTIFSIHIAFGEQNSYRGRFLPWYGFNTDIEWYNSAKSGDQDKTGIASYDCLANNQQLGQEKNPYADMYSAIERANLTLAGLKEYGNIDEDADMAYLYAETLTLRAMLYYDLIKAWGDVPARFEPLNSETMYIPKSSRDVIFNRILSDLDDAIPNLPYPGTTSTTKTVDRVNKCFAEGLYARIALAASGYALRPADGKVGTGDLGSVRLSSDGNLSKETLYPKALAYLKDAINSGYCSLESDFETLWRNVNNFDLAAGKELLFCIPFGDTDSKVRGRWNYTFAVKNENASIFGYSFNQGGTAGPTPNFWFKFAEGDSRRDISCVNWKWVKSTGLQEPAGINTWYFGKFRFDWMSKHPYNGGNDDGVKPVVMRYADVLLMAAEIANELGDLQTAKDCFLQVRSRAFKGNENLAERFVSGIVSKDDMFNAIVDERAFEFCGEFLRKADLIRWNMLGSKIEETKADLTALSELSGDYSYLTGNIWWKENDNEDGLVIWGLGPNETGSPEGKDWNQESGYISTSKLKEDKIGWLASGDPDAKQFWPIFDYILNNSQGSIKNDYGY